MVSGLGDVDGDGLSDMMVSSYGGWLGKGNAYITVNPTNITHFPSILPSSRPSSYSLPVSSCPSSSPSSHRPNSSLPITFQSGRPSLAAQSISPSYSPSILRSRFPTRVPTRKPSSQTPTIQVTPLPSLMPSSATVIPSLTPSMVRSKRPSQEPTSWPSTQSPTFAATSIETNPTDSDVNSAKQDATKINPVTISVASVFIVLIIVGTVTCVVYVSRQQTDNLAPVQKIPLYSSVDRDVVEIVTPTIDIEANQLPAAPVHNDVVALQRTPTSAQLTLQRLDEIKVDEESDSDRNSDDGEESDSDSSHNFQFLRSASPSSSLLFSENDSILATSNRHDDNIDGDDHSESIPSFSSSSSSSSNISKDHPAVPFSSCHSPSPSSVLHSSSLSVLSTENDL